MGAAATMTGAPSKEDGIGGTTRFERGKLQQKALKRLGRFQASLDNPVISASCVFGGSNGQWRLEAGKQVGITELKAWELSSTSLKLSLS